ncbi:alcohol dehydrogenase catalytic domain-containing protein [Tunturiibacter lichenicola]|uniref:alcohol dehydrogenase catalytic domain-containing protein n=1 Tax=Tunturiibacter lichenicola TaxID=2051959 RepID=UPI0028C3A539|nr:alcohol dehydrogenase catalytic domain-containing protein [Edaphobacter lichenicola]
MERRSQFRPVQTESQSIPHFQEPDSEEVMKAVCWMGKSKLETLTVSDPQLLNPHDAIIKVTRTAICGSDLHLYDGFIPTMESGDILGHEFMGIVEEVGKEVTNLHRGDRVVVPFTIACGNCFFCKKKIWAACDNSNPNAHLMEAAYGYSGSGLWLLAYDGWLCGRAGAVCSCSFRECRSFEDRK